MRRLIANTALVAASFAVAGGLAEIALRIFGAANPVAADSRSTLDDRQYFWSQGYLRLDANGAVRAEPDTVVREALYAGGAVEFDVTYRINNLGLIDHRDYPRRSAARRRVAFVGDSFTAGVGARPWVPQLRDELLPSQGIDIFNLGFVATGFRHFAALVKSVRNDTVFDE